jgi:hypothetical protein
MTSPSEPSFSSDTDRSSAETAMLEEPEFERELEAVEQSLQALKDRYLQVQQDERRQGELQQQREQIRQELQKSSLPQLKADLKQIQEQLEVLEINLESRLFSWSSLKEPFWQIVRFGGLGVMLGWVLAFTALQLPKPMPQPNPPMPQSQGREI